MCLQTLTEFWLGEGIISLTYWIYMGLITIDRAASAWDQCCQVKMSIDKLKRHKWPGIDKLPAERINAGVREIRSMIHKFTNFIWNKEELPEQ
jgi:hypothetical protein